MTRVVSYFGVGLDDFQKTYLLFSLIFSFRLQGCLSGVASRYTMQEERQHVALAWQASKNVLPKARNNSGKVSALWTHDDIVVTADKNLQPSSWPCLHKVLSNQPRSSGRYRKKAKWIN